MMLPVFAIADVLHSVQPRLVPGANSAMMLRAPYAKSGTDVGYAATRLCVLVARARVEPYAHA
eukprot:2210522-Rhodomonas_salina.4